MDDIGILIDRIRKQVINDADQKFADEAFQHLRCSQYNERMVDADAASCIADECGYVMEIYLKFHHGVVERATYMTDGETDVRLCGSCVANMAIGKSSSELLKITVSDIINRLGKNGLEVEKCAIHALAALHKAAAVHSGSGDRTIVARKSMKSSLFISAGGHSPHLQYDN
ncbi:iron-sulfur cluster assembly scaffold protein [Desulfopila sp. IMCC35008]|uniref:iron-sulfur cluster assembly scaffold protein n=1 Tax=Desulfopila sp. IMCC35008 TaxID=2653858 RepID=UPI0013D7A547|nr:iron-sulfur cluster assembly scaffold protein [Desulfopila sp. IMCC35008]